MSRLIFHRGAFHWWQKGRYAEVQPSEVRAKATSSDAELERPAPSGTDEAMAILRKQNPEVEADIGKEELTAVRELALTDEAKAAGLGTISAKRMTETRDIVVKALSLKSAVPIETIYADGFVTKK